MPRALAVLLASGAAAAGIPGCLPPADGPLPRGPRALAATLTATTRMLRRADVRWRGAGAVPQDVAALARYQERLLRTMATRRAAGDAAIALLPPDVRGFARDSVLARRDLDAIPRSPGRAPPIRLAPAAPAASLRAYYGTGERRFGIPWTVLAAVNFVESDFGRVRSASAAGARGPMQFLPATWRVYGMGGDIRDPRDAILAAANYLHRSGAPRRLAAALYAYNHSTAYVAAIRRFAHAMAAGGAAFLDYYSWQPR